MKKLFLVSTLVVLASFTMGVSLFPGCETAKDGGVFRSENGGEKFEQKERLGEKKSIATYNIKSLAVDPESPNIVYAGSESKGLFRSENSGDMWTNILAKVSVNSIAIDPKDTNRIYVSGQAGGNSRIFINSDGGLGPWEEIFIHTDTDKDIVDIAIDVNNSSIVYVISEDGHLYKSIDSGSTWSYVSSAGENINSFEVSSHNTSHMFLGADEGIFRSFDAGVNWEQLSFEGEAKKNDRTLVNSVVVDPNSSRVVLAVSKKAIYKSNDEGSTWTQIDTLIDPGSVDFAEIAIDPSNSAVVYFTADATIHKTTDGGFSWTPRLLPTTRTVVSIVIDPIDGNNIYIGLSRIKN